MIMAVLSFVFYALQGISNKEFSRRFAVRIPGMALLDALALTLIVALTAIWGGIGMISPLAFGLALAFGVLFVVTVFLIVLSMASGPLGITVLMINSSLLIPILFGILLWHEQLTLFKSIGTLLILFMLVLSGARGGKDGKRTSLKWFLLTVSALISNGTLGVLQKTLTVYCPEVKVISFNFWTFLIGGALCWLIVGMFWLKGERFRDWFDRSRELCLCAAGIGLGTVLGSSFLISSLATLPAIVTYPVVQGGSLLLIWLVSIPLYHEKIRRLDLLMLVIGLVGIVLLSI